MNKYSFKIHSPQYITFADDVLNIDVLGGVDVQQVERMF